MKEKTETACCLVLSNEETRRFPFLEPPRGLCHVFTSADTTTLSVAIFFQKNLMPLGKTISAGAGPGKKPKKACASGL